MIDRVFAIAVAQFVLAMTICGELGAATAGEEFSEATRLAAAGAFADSVTHWKKAEALFEEAEEFPGSGANGNPSRGSVPCPRPDQAGYRNSDACTGSCVGERPAFGMTRSNRSIPASANDFGFNRLLQK